MAHNVYSNVILSNKINDILTNNSKIKHLKGEADV